MWSEPNWEYVNKAPSGGKLSLVLHVSLLYLCVLDRKYKHLSVNRYISSNIISAYVFLIRVVYSYILNSQGKRTIIPPWHFVNKLI